MVVVQACLGVAEVLPLSGLVCSVEGVVQKMEEESGGLGAQAALM